MSSANWRTDGPMGSYSLKSVNLDSIKMFLIDKNAWNPWTGCAIVETWWTQDHWKCESRGPIFRYSQKCRNAPWPFFASHLNAVILFEIDALPSMTFLHSTLRPVFRHVAPRYNIKLADRRFTLRPYIPLRSGTLWPSPKYTFLLQSSTPFPIFFFLCLSYISNNKNTKQHKPVVDHYLKKEEKDQRSREVSYHRCHFNRKKKKQEKKTQKIR